MITQTSTCSNCRPLRTNCILTFVNLFKTMKRWWPTVTFFPHNVGCDHPLVPFIQTLHKNPQKILRSWLEAWAPLDRTLSYQRSRTANVIRAMRKWAERPDEGNKTCLATNIRSNVEHWTSIETRRRHARIKREGRVFSKSLKKWWIIFT